MSKTKENNIRIKFTTRETDPSLQVGDAPLYVPVSFKRYGLSEVVNHLLGNDEDDRKPIPFEFLIEGQILKGSIEEYLVSKGLSSEVSLTIEYVKSTLPPSFVASFDNDDWISSIDLNFHTKSLGKILSGSYDGVVRTWDLTGKAQLSLVGHTAAVKAVKYISDSRIVSGGNDNQLRIWKIASSSTEADLETDGADESTGRVVNSTLAILEAHKAPITSIDVHSQSQRILSSSGDKQICIWSTVPKQMSTVTPQAALAASKLTSIQKRRKVALKADSSINFKSPLSTMDGHSAPVSQIIFNPSDPSVGYSVSEDHSIRTWDLVTSRCVDSKTTGFSLLSVCGLKELGLLCAGSSARHILLHDPRAAASGGDQITVGQLVGHKNFVVALAPSPLNQYEIASASHDGTVKLWDIRSLNALYTIKRQDAPAKGEPLKVFDVKWDRDIGIVSGGQDKKIQINSNGEPRE